MPDPTAQFDIGELVQHRLFGYRGVVYDIDADFQGTEEWYEQMARTRPPKDEPWYHVLVHQAAHVTYVAERNLESDASGDPVDHPAIRLTFAGFSNGRYQVPRAAN